MPSRLPRQRALPRHTVRVSAWSRCRHRSIYADVRIARRAGLPPAAAASALFQVVSQRYLKTSIILTSNRGVGSWGEALGDTTVAAALLDRLLPRSVVLNLDGDSYRLREHHARNETLRTATTGTRQPLH